MSIKVRTKLAGRVFSLLLLLAAASFAADEWVKFKGQVNGPVAGPSGTDLETFRLKHYPGLFWTEGYYHHMNFPDGSMITVSIGFNRSEASLAFVYGKPGMKPVNDYIIVDFDEARFDEQGFGYTFGKNRVRLDEDKYRLDIELEKVKVRITYDILAPSYCYGDGMVRYPDGHTYMYYSLPIPRARAHAKGVIAGKEYDLSGWGNMNHDAGDIFPTSIPYNWQVFWFFGEDHSLAVTDHYTHDKFGRVRIQRLVFVDRDGRMFTSIEYPFSWDDWVDADGIRFRYPRHYELTSEAGGEKLHVEATMRESLLLEDLYSNLPSFLRAIAERLTPNGWTMDSWSEYTITYSHGGKTDTYQGKGIVRWMNLEERKK
jgi:hypothetical protein